MKEEISTKIQIQNLQKNNIIKIELIKKGIKSFNEIEIESSCTNLDLSYNKIRNFEGIKENNKIINLNLDYCLISSFKGASFLTNLRWISLKKNPIIRNPYFKLMCVIVFGKKLSIINNEQIPIKIKEQAIKLSPFLYEDLINGRILTNLNPVRIIDVEDKSQVLPDSDLLNLTSSIIYPTLEFKNQSFNEEIIKPSIAVICSEIQSENLPEGILTEDIIKKIQLKFKNLKEKYNQFELLEEEDEDEEEEF